MFTSGDAAKANRAQGTIGKFIQASKDLCDEQASNVQKYSDIVRYVQRKNEAIENDTIMDQRDRIWLQQAFPGWQWYRYADNWYRITHGPHQGYVELFDSHRYQHSSATEVYDEQDQTEVEPPTLDAGEQWASMLEHNYQDSDDDWRMYSAPIAHPAERQIQPHERVAICQLSIMARRILYWVHMLQRYTTVVSVGALPTVTDLSITQVMDTLTKNAAVFKLNHNNTTVKLKDFYATFAAYVQLHCGVDGKGGGS